MVGEAWVGFATEELKRKVINDGPALRTMTMNNNIFCQMIAKIAHSYAVAEWGINSFRPLLLDLILGRSQTASYWVGGNMTVMPPDPNGLHRLQLKKEIILGTEYVIAYITLFCFFGSPEYRVVVGVCKGDPH
jgi:hypothetical protein